MEKLFKRLLSLAVVLVMVLSMVPGNALRVYAADTADLTVSTAAELAAFAETVNGGETYAGKTVVLAADIDLAGSETNLWTPIGPSGDSGNKFRGTFDGQGHTIKNLYVKQDAAYHAAGLFGATCGTVKNLTIDGAYVESLSTGNSDGATVNGTAVLAGSTAYGATIENVHVKNATVKGNRYVAGIVGYMDGSVINCSVENVTMVATPDDLTGSYDNGDKVGGIVGYCNSNSVEVSGCELKGTVDITAYRDVAGIVGCASTGVKINNNTNSAVLTITVDQITNYYGDKTHNAAEFVSTRTNPAEAAGNTQAEGASCTITEAEAASGTITPGYTRADGVWGEATANASESFYVELYVGETKIATTQLNNIGGIIDGDVYVTWSIPFAGSFDDYWTVIWEEGYPDASQQPTKVVLYCDGKAVAENDVQMNGPDDLNPVAWEEVVEAATMPIQVTYADGSVAYFDDMLEAVPYTTNYPKLEGATVKLLKDVSAPGIRMMENDMVLDLNGKTYTITDGTGSQGTNTSGFQIRPEVTTVATIKNGTIQVAEGAPVVWMFNNYAANFVVEDVTVDCANMAYSYGSSVYTHVSRSGDNTQLLGNTKFINFNSEAAGSAVNVGGTMTIADTVVPGGTIELDAGAAITAVEGLDVVTVDGYKVVYADGSYTTVAVDYVAQVGTAKYETLAEALEAAKAEKDIVIDLLTDATLDITAWQTLAIGGETTETITINGNGNTLTFNKKNSDWNHIATNNGAKLILNDMTITDSGYNNGPWNRYDLNFACDVELNNVTATKAIALKAAAKLTDVTVNETGDNYAVWIQPNGQSVEIGGLTVISVGRGIKIDNQYVDAAQKVTLSVKDAAFTTNKKAAILVKSPAGADITLENVDISGVEADTVNAVWNDEDSAAYFSMITVTGGTKAQEGAFVAALSDAEGNIIAYYKDLAEALNACQSKQTVTLLTDVDLNNEAWTPIAAFYGTFDGQNHTIKNLYVDNGTASNAGLFGSTYSGEIKNLVIENAKVSGRLNVGVVAGTPYTSKYTNIKVTGHVEVNGMAYVGGVGGKNAYADWTDITVDVDETSYVKANSVENDIAYRTYVGGVVGFMGEGGHSFQNITSNIDVTGSTCDVGGITGIAHYGNKFINVSCSGDVTIDNAQDLGDAMEIGGIAGVWHNQTGYTVTFENIEYTGTLRNNVGLTEYANDGLIGAAYNTTGTGTLTGDVAAVNGKSYATLAEAFAVATDGDTVYLLTDVALDANIVVSKKSITFDGQGHTISQTEGLTLKDYAAGLRFDGTSGDITAYSYTVKNVVFDGWQTRSVLAIHQCAATVDNVTIQNTAWDKNVQAMSYGLLYLENTDITVKNSTFTNNVAEFVLTYNYGSPASTAKLVIDNCEFSNNKTGLNAATAYYVTGSGCTITNSRFVGNTVNSGGNAAILYLGFQENCTVTGCLFKGNTVTTSAASKRVAGAIFFGYEAEISGNAFVNNTAANANGDALGQDICTSTYYTGTIDLSGNYFDGGKPVEGVDYLIQHKDGDGTFALTDYCTTYVENADNKGVTLGESKKMPAANMTYSAYGFKATGEGEKYRENFMIDLYGVCAEESLVVELYSNGTLVAVTTLRNTDRDDETSVIARPIDADSYTVNVVVAGRLAGSWDTEWKVAPCVDHIPDTVMIYADGALVDTYENAFAAEDAADYAALPGVYKAASVTAADGTVRYYGTLQAAIDAAAPGETVTVLADITLTEKDVAYDYDGSTVKYGHIYVAADKDITLDLNGHTVANENISGEVRYDILVNEGKLTLTDSAQTKGALASNNACDKLSVLSDGSETDWVGYSGGFAVVNQGTMTIADAVIDGNNGSYAVISQGADTAMTLNNATVTGRGALAAYSGTAMVVNGGSYTIDVITKNARDNVLYATGSGTTVTINGGSFDGTQKPLGSDSSVTSHYNKGSSAIMAQSGAEVIVNSGTFAASEASAYAYSGNITLNGGIFANQLVERTGYNVTVFGGIFAEDPDAFCAVGYKAAANTDTATLEAYPYATTVNALVVAWNVNTGVEYEDLSAALTEASVGDTVQLLQDVQTKAILNILGILDLNGHKLTAESYVMAVLTGTGIIDSSADKSGVLVTDISNLKMLDTKPALPIQTDTNCFRFVEVELYQMFSTKNSRFQFWFTAVDQLLLDAANASSLADLNVRFEIELKWDGGSQKFYIDAENTAKYMENWSEGLLYLKLTNPETVTDLTYCARIVFAAETAAEVVISTGDQTAHVYES